jgi:hypothetical protein
MRSMKYAAVAVIALVECVACGGPAGSGAGSDEVVGRTQEAFSGYWFYQYTFTRESTNALQNGVDLGPVSGRTCLISGLSGNLPSGASMEIFQWGTDYNLVPVLGNQNDPLTVTVMCVPSPELSDATIDPVGTWNSGDEARIIAPFQSNIRCGLAGVFGGPSSAAGSVEVFHDTKNWYLTGTSNANIQAAWANCFEASDNDLWSWTWEPATFAESNLPLLWAPTYGNSTTQCYLTGIGGQLNDTTGNLSNGVSVEYDGNAWVLDVAPGLKGIANCAQ